MYSFVGVGIVYNCTITWVKQNKHFFYIMFTIRNLIFFLIAILQQKVYLSIFFHLSWTTFEILNIQFTFYFYLYRLHAATDIFLHIFSFSYFIFAVWLHILFLRDMYIFIHLLRWGTAILNRADWGSG